MKKKIKDTTIAEVRSICKIHVCHECPLYKKDEELEDHRICLLDNPEFIPEFMLDEEVEVPDEIIESVLNVLHTSKEAWNDLFAYMKEHGFICSINN